MKQRIYKIFCGIVILCTIAMLTINDNIVYAAGATVSISTSTVTQGNEFEVTITATSDEKMAGYTFMLEYDPEIIEVVSGHDGGGGGQISVADAFAPGVNEFTKVIVFKAKTSGTTSIKYTCLDESWGILNDSDLSNMAVTAKDGSVTVKAPVVASGNNNLSSLTVAAVKSDGSSYNVNLTPGFSKDVTEYNIQAEEGVVKLAITAKAEDTKASVKVEWAGLDPGENTTKVTVTAENGSTKLYKIYTKVPVQETTTPAPEEPITVDIGGVQHFIEDIGDAVALPEGFETAEYDYNGETVVVGKGLSKELIVMYITNGDGSAGSLYIYDETKNTFYPMINIEMTQKLYTIVEVPDDVTVPAGFEADTVNVGELSFQGWKNKDIEGIYLVYAMNWDGNKGFYFYDDVEKQMIKYFDTSVEAGATQDAYDELLKENEKLKSDIEKLQNEHGTSDIQTSGGNIKEEGSELYKYIAIGCGVAVIILLGVIIVLLTKNKDEEYDDENDDEEDDDDENVKADEKASGEKTEDAVTDETITEENIIEENISGETVTDEIAAEETVVEEAATEKTAAVEEITEIAIDETDSEEVSETVAGENFTEKKSHDVTELFRDVLFGSKLTEEVSEEITPEVPSAEEIVVEETAVKGTEAEETAEEVATEETAEEVEAEETTVEEATSEEVEAEEAATEEAATEETVVEENVIEETVIEETVIEETVIEETVVEETAVEETAVEEAAVEEATTEEVLENSPEEQITPEDEKKKKVEEILNDEKSSIDKEDMDLVIDELFDELFGE